MEENIFNRIERILLKNKKNMYRCFTLATLSKYEESKAPVGKCNFANILQARWQSKLNRYQVVSCSCQVFFFIVYYQVFLKEKEEYSMLLMLIITLRHSCTDVNYH